MCVFVCVRVKYQRSKKTIFFVNQLSCWILRKIGLGWDESSKKHWFLPGSKVKKTFYLFIRFRVGSRGNLASAETKVKKNIDFFRVQRSKKHFLDFSRFVFNVKAWGSEMGSKVEKHWFFRVSKVKNALYTFEYHAQKMWTNQIEEPWKLINQIDLHPELSLSCVFVRWFFPIRFFRIGSLGNRVVFYWESNQSGNFAIRLSSSQAFQARSFVNPGLCGCEISHSGFFLGNRSANQLSWA